LKENRSDLTDGASSSPKYSHENRASKQKDRRSRTPEATKDAVTPPSTSNNPFDPNETPPLIRTHRIPLRQFKERTPRVNLVSSTLSSMTANYDTLLMDVSGLSGVQTPDISIISDEDACSRDGCDKAPQDAAVLELSGPDSPEKEHFCSGPGKQDGGASRDLVKRRSGCF
jgi:hypothetical protein